MPARTDRLSAIVLTVGIAVLAAGESRAGSAATATTPPASPAISPATAACINKAAADQAACNVLASLAACQAKYDRALPNCFAPGRGVACAAACMAKTAKCVASAARSTNTQCTKVCQSNRTAAGTRCAGDQACLAAARDAYTACADTCNPAVLKCRAAFAACLTKCPNLGTITTTTTTLPPRPTTTTTTTPPRPSTTTSTLPDPPQVTITSPKTGTTVSLGQVITLSGTASDRQDGDLSLSLQWTSNLDGPLGTGPSITRTLSFGPHTITASVRDSTMKASSASVVVKVNEGDVGFRDFAYPSFLGTGAENEATAQKPESKLWFLDGTWWAALYSQSAGAHRIHWLDREAQRWIDTGVPIDERPMARQDVLWDGAKLYMVSRAGFNVTPAENRLLRYTYDPTVKTYVLDPGFPVSISEGGTESMTIAKDSTDTLWVAYTLAGQVFVNCTLGSDDQWGTPFLIPVAQGTNVASDIAGVIALPSPAGPGAIGVFWTNQNAQADYFALHVDGTPATDPAAWQEELPIAGKKSADDHFNMKVASDGRLFVGIKTSRTSPKDILIGLLVRSPAGAWSPLYNVATFDTAATRPLVLLDEGHRRIYFFFSPFHAAINYKTSDMDTIAFPDGAGTPFIASSSVGDINNPTSTKQNITPSSGIEVIASSPGDLSYWHDGLFP